MTKEEIKKEFIGLIQCFVDKYEGEFEVKDVYQGYGYGRYDYQAIVSIPSKWDMDGNQIQEYCEFEVGNYLCHQQHPSTAECCVKLKKLNIEERYNG